MVPQWIIEKKRDGKALTPQEIREFIGGYAEGTIPDYQMSALAMAIFFKGMSQEEVTVMTDAMMRSGRILDLSSIRLPKVDKHSTGGIGDKTSLILAPLVACCGVAVPMISGRALGITGGTLDKLESIPGYRTNLSPREFMKAIERCGCSVIGQTAELAPADKRLYALRDVTGTVASTPLISASIMSKKLAEGTDNLVLDVKWGKGAFMKTMQHGRDLARMMVDIGRRMRKGMTAIITDMNQPLGHSVGNSLEVAESIAFLRGQPTSRDLTEVTLLLGSHMLILARKARTIPEARALLLRAIESGCAFEHFKLMVQTHGGDVSVLDNPSKLPTAKFKYPVKAAQKGFVNMVDAEVIGRVCLMLGAGRRRVEDSVDHAVGLSDIVKIGDKLDKGALLCVIHANSRSTLEDVKPLVERAFALVPKRPSPPRLIVETITTG